MKKFLIIFLIGMFFLGFCLLNVFGINMKFLQAQESSSEDSQNINITLVGLIRGAGAPNYLGGASSIFVEGKYAYVTSGFWDEEGTINDNALSIFDISNPSNPTLAGSVHGNGTPNYLGGANNVYVSGNYAYVTSYDDCSLTIFDISNPANPVFEGLIKGQGEPNYLADANSVFISNKNAFITGVGDNALSIFEISEKKTDNTPTETISTPDTNPTGDDNVSILRQWLRIHNPYSS